jgi:hypothetical protein
VAVREKCPKPLVHDLKIVIVPFLKALVDPSAAKKGAIEG